METVLYSHQDNLFGLITSIHELVWIMVPHEQKPRYPNCPKTKSMLFQRFLSRYAYLTTQKAISMPLDLYGKSA